MERSGSINLISLEDSDELFYYKKELVQSALATEGILVSSDFVDAILLDDLARIGFKGTDGNALTMQELNTVMDVLCAVELLFTLIRSGTFSMNFAAVSSLATQVDRRRAIDGLYISTVYATNLQGFGDRIQGGLNRIVGDMTVLPEDEDEKLSIVLAKCKEIVKFFSGEDWFICGNKIIAYLLTNGLLFTKTGFLYLLDTADGADSIAEEFATGGIFS